MILEYFAGHIAIFMAVEEATEETKKQRGGFGAFLSSPKVFKCIKEEKNYTESFGIRCWPLCQQDALEILAKINNL